MGFRGFINIAGEIDGTNGSFSLTASTIAAISYNIASGQLKPFAPPILAPGGGNDGSPITGSAGNGAAMFIEDQLTSSLRAKNQTIQQKLVSAFSWLSNHSRSVREINAGSMHTIDDRLRDSEAATEAFTQKENVSFRYGDFNWDAIEGLKTIFNP